MVRNIRRRKTKRSNVGDLEKMQKATRASFYHVSSSNFMKLLVLLSNNVANFGIFFVVSLFL